MEVIRRIEEYLAAAAHTTAYVDSKMDIGTSNKFFNNFWGLPARLQCVSETRKSIVSDLKNQKDRAAPGVDPRKLMVETWAYHAVSNGCGNCGEQSAIAFVHLRDKYKMLPIDWMQIDSFAHGFVVLGRIGVTNPADASTWNDEAVICDPYYGEACAARASSRLRGKTIGLLYRETDDRTKPTLGRAGASMAS